MELSGRTQAKYCKVSLTGQRQLAKGMAHCQAAGGNKSGGSWSQKHRFSPIEPLTSSVDFWGTCREKDVMVTTVIVFLIWPAADLRHLEAYI